MDKDTDSEPNYWLWGTSGLIALIALTWVLVANDFSLFRTFAPKYEAARRQTFEESKAYNQGAVQELQNMQMEYVQADKPHQAALRSIILHRAADYDERRMPPDLREFIDGLKRQEGLK